MPNLDHLAFWRPALRVLCYHRVIPAGPSRFTVTVDQLDAHLRYLVQSGFHFIRARDLFSGEALPERPVLLTFDDGYSDNLEYALPVLRKHRANATIFVVTGYAGGHARWSDDAAALMSAQQLRSLDPELVELGLHSHSHRAYAELALDQIEDDLRKSLAFFQEHQLTLTPVFAYPYGSRPKNRMNELAKSLANLGIVLGFRVGNRVNRLPLATPYEIQRIDVSGVASESTFRRKLWLGRFP